MLAKLTLAVSMPPVIHLILICIYPDEMRNCGRRNLYDRRSNVSFYSNHLILPMVRYTGHCHCKAVTYEINFKNGETFPRAPSVDFCGDCRRVAGSLLVPILLVPRLSADRVDLHIRVASDMAYGKGQTNHVQIVRNRGKTVLLSLRLSIYLFELGTARCRRQGESNGYFDWNIG